VFFDDRGEWNCFTKECGESVDFLAAVQNEPVHTGVSVQRFVPVEEFPVRRAGSLEGVCEGVQMGERDVRKG